MEDTQPNQDYTELARVIMLQAKQVQTLLGVSIATANRKIKKVKQILNIEKHQPISLLNLCETLELDMIKTVENYLITF